MQGNEIHLAATSTAPRAAREFLREALGTQDLDGLGDLSELLTTELVANVVDHVGGKANFTLELSVSGTWLRIAVVDGSAIRPVIQELSHDRPRGRGIRMVEAIADRWGVEDENGGKRVWFDMYPAAG